MKTYLLDTIERFKRYSQSLDVKTILCSKAWYVLNEDGDTENLIFQEDGTVLVSVNGSLKKYTWQYIPQNQSLNIMHSDKEGTMLKPAFMDGKILAFNKTGTKECMFLVDDNLRDKEKLQSIDAVKKYLLAYEEHEIEQAKQLEQKRIDDEKRMKQNRLLLIQQKQKEEKEKKRKQLLKEIEEKKGQIEKIEQELQKIQTDEYWYEVFQRYLKEYGSKYEKRLRFRAGFRSFLIWIPICILETLLVIGIPVGLLFAVIDTFDVNGNLACGMILLLLAALLIGASCLFSEFNENKVMPYYNNQKEKNIYKLGYKKIYLKHCRETGNKYPGFNFNIYKRIVEIGKYTAPALRKALPIYRQELKELNFKLYQLDYANKN